MATRVCIVLPDPKKIYILEKEWQKYPHTFSQRYLRYGTYQLCDKGYDKVFQVVYKSPDLHLLQKFHHPSIQYIVLEMPSTTHRLPSLASFHIPFSAEDTAEDIDSHFNSRISPERELIFNQLATHTWEIDIDIKWYAPTEELQQVKNFIENECKTKGIFLCHCTVIGAEDINKTTDLKWKTFLHPPFPISGSNIDLDVTDEISCIPAFQAIFNNYIPSWYYISQSVIHTWWYNLSDVLDNAYEQTGKDKRVIKAVHGSSWEGIHIVTRKDDMRQYKEKDTSMHNINTFPFNMWDIIIEEFIFGIPLGNILHHSFFDICANDPLTLTTHYQKWRVFWEPLLQLTTQNERIGDIYISHEIRLLLQRSNILPTQIDLLNTLTQQFIDLFWLTGDWCIDWIYDTSKKQFVLLDPNICRDGWDMPLKRFIKCRITAENHSNILYFNKFNFNDTIQKKLKDPDLNASCQIYPVYIYEKQASLIIVWNKFDNILQQANTFMN